MASVINTFTKPLLAVGASDITSTNDLVLAVHAAAHGVYVEKRWMG